MGPFVKSEEYNCWKSDVYSFGVTLIDILTCSVAEEIDL